MRGSIFASAMVVLGACELKPDEGGVDPGEDPVAGYTSGVLDVSACGLEVPMARSHALVTSYFEPDGLLYRPYGGISQFSERGLLMVAGQTHDALPLQDVWLLDLSQVGSSGSETCPWHYLGDTVSRAAGGLYYSPDDKRFRTVDGREDLGSGWRDSTTNLLIDTAVPGVRTLFDPGSVPSNFFAVAALEGSPVCTSTYLECRCFDEASCGGLPDDTALSAWQLGVPFGQEFSLRRAVCEPRGSWASNADLACLPTIQSSGDPSQCDIQCEDDAVGLLDGCLAGPFCAGFSPSGAGFVTNSRVLNRRGLHGLGFASDPLSGIAFSYGGSAGCTELGCGDAELTFEGTDLIVAISTLDLANTAGLLKSWSSSMGDFSIDEAWQDPLEPLSDGTIGVRGAAIAVTGFGDFDLVNKSFVTPPTEIAMWGGSFHQEVVPESRYEVGGAFAEVGAWARWEQLDDSNPEFHLLPGAFKFRVVNLTTGGIQNLSGVENAGVFEAAAVGLSGRRVATLGGVLDTGNLVEQLLVLNTATGNSVASFAGVPMLAPGGGHDPLGRSAIFVGSAPGDSFVTVQYVDAPELESAPKVDVDAAIDKVSYQLSFDDLGSPDSYTQETVSEFVIRCPEGTTRCWTDTVRIRVPDRADFASIEATLELPSGSLPLRVAEGDRAANSQEFVGVVLESPVSLVGVNGGAADGYVLRVTATVRPPEVPALNAEEFADEDQDGRVQWTRVPAGGSCSETRRLAVGGLPSSPRASVSIW